MGDWITTANGLVSLIIGLIGLIGTGVGTFLAIKGWVKAEEEKGTKDLWSMIMEMADAAIITAEKSGKSGADKKAMVIETVKASAKAGGIELDAFLDQLSAYIDDCVKFANSFNKK